MVELVNSGIQPLHNLQVNNYVKDVLKGDPKAWAATWIDKGLDALEAMAKDSSGTFMFGDEFTFADACLLPQLYGARRFGVDVTRFPTLLRVEASCAPLPAFVAALPERQPDAETDPA